MALPELLANSPTPGAFVPITWLAAPIASTSVTSITTLGAAPAALQASGQFRIVLDSEIMLVTAGQSGTSWTVTRGVEGSAPATHVAGDGVFHMPTAGALVAAFDAAGSATAAQAASLQKSSNLSDIVSAGTGRFNLHDPSLTPAAVLATSNVASLSGLQTVDGYTLIAGDHVLLVGQSTGSQNGPWVAASGSWTRPATYPSGGSIGGATGGTRTIDIIQGTVGKGGRWLLATNTAITVDTTATIWQLQQTPSVVNGSSLVVPRIDIAGHSIPAAGGAVGGDQNAYPDRVAKALGVRTRANIAQGGAVACWPSANASGDGGWSWILSNFRPTNSGDGNGGYQPNTSIAIPHLGLNDLAELGSLTPKPFIEAMRTILSRYCAAALFPDTDASWAYTGTWTPITANWTYAGGTAHSTTTVTDRATWTTPADYPGNLICAIQLAMIPGAVSAGRSITLGISIDGGAVTNYVFSLDKGGYADAENGKTNGIVLRIGRADQGLGIALSAAQHTIAISYVSGVGSPSLIVNGAWIEADPLDGPVLVVPSSYRAVSPTNNGYNIWAAYTHGPAAGVDPMNDASVATWNTALQTLLGDFPGRSVWVDIDAVIGKQAQYLSPTDYTHPTNRGHQLIAQTIHSAIIASGLLTPRLRSAASAERFADSWDGGLWRPIGGAFGTSIGIAFLNSWVDYGNTTVWAPCGYRKDLEGRVHLRGTVKSGSAANAIMFQLPASYCPLIGLNLPSVSQGGTFANMQLGSSSVLNVVAQNGGSTTWTVLPMVPFIAGD